jgi:hypothetical protein
MLPVASLKHVSKMNLRFGLAGPQSFLGPNFVLKLHLKTPMTDLRHALKMPSDIPKMDCRQTLKLASLTLLGRPQKICCRCFRSDFRISLRTATEQASSSALLPQKFTLSWSETWPHYCPKIGLRTGLKSLPQTTPFDLRKLPQILALGCLRTRPCNLPQISLRSASNSPLNPLGSAPQICQQFGLRTVTKTRFRAPSRCGSLRESSPCCGFPFKTLIKARPRLIGL